MLTNKEIKQRFFNKILENALVIPCLCGCGTLIKNKDKYGRDKHFVSGHNGRKYEDKTQHKREWNHRNRESRYQLKKAYHLERKLKLMALKDSKCFDCGINHNGKNAAIFHFHHRNPEEKLFAIGNKLTCKSWDTLLIEIEKCNLLCANCHEMTHSQEF